MRHIVLKTGLLAVCFLAMACDKETVVAADRMPDTVKSYIATHFPDKEVVQVIRDRDGFTTSYEVYLSGSVKLSFNRKNEIEDIEGQHKLPDTVIPDKVLAYVAENYPDRHIIGWELDDRHQQVELDNGLELEFTMEGVFLRTDR